MANKEVQFTLSDAVDEVLGTLTGLDLSYVPEMDRFQAITRSLNKALRLVALEHEWSFYASTEDVGTTEVGMREVEISPSLRPRITGDDSIKLVNDEGHICEWAFYLSRDALSKYQHRRGLWVSITRTMLTFSRPLVEGEHGLHIVVPCMREPGCSGCPRTRSRCRPES